MVVVVDRIVWPNISQTMDPKVISMYNIFGQRGVCVCKQTTSLCRTLLYHYPLFYKRNVCSQHLQTRSDDDFFLCQTLHWRSCFTIRIFQIN